MTIRFDAPLYAGKVQFGVNGLGIPGSAIPTNSVLYPLLSLPAQNTNEFRATVVTIPAGLTTFSLSEDGVVTSTGPNGIYRGIFQAFMDGASTGYSTFTFTIGTATAGMLRNMNQIFGSKRLCTTPQVGLIGSSIPSTGTDGPPFAYSSLSFPTDNNNLVRGFITSYPTAGSLVADDDTSFTFSGAPDGSYSATYEIRINDVLQTPAGTLSLNIGNPASSLSATTDDETFSISGTGTGPVTISLSATTDDSLFNGSAVVPSVATFSVVTDAETIAITSFASPIIVSNITLDDALAAGTAGSGGTIVGNLATDNAIFSGTVDSSVVIYSSASLVTDDVIFTGFALSSVPSSSIATFGDITDDVVLTGSASVIPAVTGSVTAGIITEDALISTSALGYTGTGVSSIAVIGTNVDDAQFTGSGSGLLTTYCAMTAYLEDATTGMSASGYMIGFDLNSTTDDAIPSISARSGTSASSLVVTTDSDVFSGSVDSQAVVTPGSCSINAILANETLNLSAFGTTQLPGPATPTGKLPITIGLTIGGKPILLL